MRESTSKWNYRNQRKLTFSDTKNAVECGRAGFSPDSIVGENGIFEVKCPENDFDQSL